MNWTRCVIAAVLSFVVLAVVWIVWNEIVFKDFIAQQLAPVARPAPLVGLWALAQAARAVLFTVIYPMGYKGGTPWLEGLRFGLMMGLVSGMISVIVFSGINIVSAAYLWMRLAYFLVECGLAGIVIGLAYGATAAKKL